MVVMAVVVRTGVMRVCVVGTGVMMFTGSEGRANKHHQEQCCCKNLFHGLNVPRASRLR
jgi:hypothetical protein